MKAKVCIVLMCVLSAGLFGLNVGWCLGHQSERAFQHAVLFGMWNMMLHHSLTLMNRGYAN